MRQRPLGQAILGGVHSRKDPQPGSINFEAQRAKGPQGVGPNIQYRVVFVSGLISWAAYPFGGLVCGGSNRDKRIANLASIEYLTERYSR
jgi:hypothetical protein